MATETIKFAGPDSEGNFKVLSTKNTYLVDSGEVFTRRVYRELVDMAKRRPTHRKLDVACVEYREDTEMRRFGMEGGAPTFSMLAGGKVKDHLD